MSTEKERNQNKDLHERLTDVESDISKVIIPQLNKIVQFIEDNRSGILTATVLNSKIISLALGGIVVAGLFIAAKGSL
jgi:hypothetical protein